MTSGARLEKRGTVSAWLTPSALEYWAETCKPRDPEAAKPERTGRDTTDRQAQRLPAAPGPSCSSLPSPSANPVRELLDQSSPPPLSHQCGQAETSILSILHCEFLVFKIHKHNKTLLDIRKILYNLFCSDSNWNSGSPGTQEYKLQLKRGRFPSLCSLTLDHSHFFYTLLAHAIMTFKGRGHRTHLLGAGW